MNGLTLHNAIENMRKLTALNIPFSVEYITFSDANAQSNGKKVVTHALLRTGYSANVSTLSELLIGYLNESNENRWFYLPLLIKFNGLTITP
jgi:hypothetical protein